MSVPTLDEHIQIQEILAEARAYGLQHEVNEWADKFMDESPELTPLQAYAMAFNEWIK
jgi:hypothetical protein